ncbi:MAG: ABC transporter permease [Chloroflexi bacterium]|nr:ABC transporter permease [Chloroflexota bacterium]
MLATNMANQVQTLEQMKTINLDGLRERFRVPFALARHSSGRWGLIIVLLICFVAIFADQLAPFDPYNIEQRFQRGLPPNAQNWLGTDGSGIDVLSALVQGTRISLIVGIATALLISFTGALAGVAAGYLGGWVDIVLMRTVDILMCIPSLPLMIVLAAYLGTQFWVIIFIFVILGWAGLARLIRAQVLSVKSRPYVESAIVAGASTWRVMWRHILPAVSSLVIVNGVLMASGMILAEAGLSFLGFGDPKAISWGKMLSQAQSGSAILLGMWWWILPPGLAIVLTTLGFLLLGYALEEIMNPYLHKHHINMKAIRQKKSRR